MNVLSPTVNARRALARRSNPLSGKPLRRDCFVEVLRFRSVLLLAMTACALSSCETSIDSAFHPQIVVQGFLYADEPLDSIVVRTTIPLTSTNPNDRISGAFVVLSSDSSADTLREDPVIAGRYIPSYPIITAADRTYRLLVTVSNIGTATAETHIPVAIHLDSAALNGQSLPMNTVDTVAYPFNIDVSTAPNIHLWWSSSPGSVGYGLEAVSLDPLADTIVHTNLELADSNATGRYRFFILSTDEDLVWIQFMRTGLNAIRALALDQNYQDYISGLYLSRSQFNNNTLHINGGLGVFASAARATMQVFLK